MGGRLLLAAWAVVLLTLAGTAIWLATVGSPPAAGPSLVLALPPPPAAPAAQAGAVAPEGGPPPLASSGPPEPPSAAPSPPPGDPAGQPGTTSPSGSAPAVPAWQQVARAREGTPALAEEPKPAWQAHARPFAAPADRPRIAVVVTNLGLAETVARSAIEQLPPNVTLAFLPYAENVDDWVKRARAAGHEVLLNLPMEAAGQDDPGPKALMTALDAEQNLERLDWVLGRASGYVGVMPTMGSRFLTSEEHMRPVLADLRDRGLMFVDSGTTPRSVAVALAGDLRLSRAANDRFIDGEPTRNAIDRRLKEVEQIARETGAAVAVGRPYPSTIDRLAEWTQSLETRGYALAPISAVADRQSLK